MDTLLFAIVAHWLIVQYVVEAEITRPFREWVGGLYQECYNSYPPERVGRIECKHPAVQWSKSTWRRPKLKYLVDCRMCSGFWVAVTFGIMLGLSPLTTLAVAGLSHWLFIVQRIAEKLAK